MTLALVVVEMDVQIIETDSACQKHYFADIIYMLNENICGCYALFCCSWEMIAIKTYIKY